MVWVDPVPLRDGLPQFHGDPLIHAILARRLVDAGDAEDFLNADESRPRIHISCRG